MSTTVTVKYPGDAGYTDISHLIRFDSQEFDQQLFNAARRSCIDTYRCKIKYDKATYDKFIAATSRILIWVADGGTAKFVGAIAPTYQMNLKGSVREDLILKAHDNSYLLDEPLNTSFSYPAAVGGSAFKIYDSGDTANSIVYQLLDDAGYTPATDISAACPGITTTIEHIAGTAGEETYREVLDTLLKEHGYVLTYEPDGEFTMVQWDLNAISADAVIDDDYGDRNGLTIKRHWYRNDGAEIEWSETSTINGALLYRDNLPLTNQDGKMAFTGEAIANTDYYPPDSDINDIYQTFETRWLDEPYLMRETRLKNKDIGLIASSGHAVRYTADDDVDIDSATFESHRGKVSFQNNSGATASIYTFEILGNTLFRKNRRKSLCPTTSTDPLQYTSRTLFNVTQADRFARAMARVQEYGSSRYELSTRVEHGIGDIFNIQQTDVTLNTNALVYRKRWNWDRPMYSFEAEGISAYSADATTETSSGAPSPAIVNTTIDTYFSLQMPTFEDPGAIVGGVPGTSTWEPTVGGGAPGDTDFIKPVGGVKPSETAFQLDGDIAGNGYSLLDCNLRLRDNYNRTINISNATGIEAKDGAGHIVHDIPDGALASNYRYIGHLYWYDDAGAGDGTYRIYNATPTDDVWTDITCIIPSGATNVTAGLFKVYMYRAQSAATSISPGAYFRAKGTSYYQAIMSATPQVYIFQQHSAVELTAIAIVDTIVCPIGTDNKIQIYSDDSNTAYQIVQLGFYA